MSITLEKLLTFDGVLSRKLATPRLNEATRQSLQAQLNKIKARIHAMVTEEERHDPALEIVRLKAKRKQVRAWAREAEVVGDDERAERLEIWIENITEQIDELEDEVFNQELDAVFGPG
jgi:hypothetical protein